MGVQENMEPKDSGWLPIWLPDTVVTVRMVRTVITVGAVAAAVPLMMAMPLPLAAVVVPAVAVGTVEAPAGVAALQSDLRISSPTACS